MSNRIPNTSVAEQAEAWFVHLESEEATAAEREAFQDWLDQSVAHRAAFTELAKLCDGISTLRHVGSAAHLAAGDSATIVKFPVFNRALAVVASADRRGWQAHAVKLAAVILVAVVGIWGAARWDASPQASYATQNAQIKTIALADGSTVTLGAKSSIEVRYTDDERHVRLSGGEAFFSVRPDAGRPFFVKASDAVVRVVGTQFSVHASAERITVAVAEGVVEVLKGRATPMSLFSGGSTERLRLLAGQKLVVARGDGDVGEVKPIKKEDAGSWRLGHLIYDDVPLREVIADANRYYSHHIVIPSDEVGDLRVTAAFPSQQIERMLEGLAGLLPIRVEHDSSGQVVLVPSVTYTESQSSSR